MKNRRRYKDLKDYVIQFNTDICYNCFNNLPATYSNGELMQSIRNNFYYIERVTFHTIYEKVLVLFYIKGDLDERNCLSLDEWKKYLEPLKKDIVLRNSLRKIFETISSNRKRIIKDIL